MKLRIANTSEVKRYYYEEVDEDGNVTATDNETWLDLQAEMSKKQANGILRFAPRENGDIDSGLRFLEKAFSDLIVGWSLEDEDGNQIPPSLAVYEQLDASGASWIDRTVGKHLQFAFGNAAENAEKKEES